MSASSTSSSLMRSGIAATSNSYNAAIPAASHHLPPVLHGYRFLKHMRSALSHDTFLGQVVEQEGNNSAEATKQVIRVYALDYLRRDEECRFMIERECMAGRIIFSHPHLLMVEKAFASQTDLFLVELYCSGGDLYKYMVSVAEAAERVDEHAEDSVAGKGLPVELAQRLTRELLTAVHFLHTTCFLVHRNIKLETLFLDADMSLRLGGFGLCAVLPTTSNGGEREMSESNRINNSGDAAAQETQEGEEGAKKDAARPAAASVSSSPMKLCCGSKHYAAPELIQGQPYQGEAVDAWACGVVLFALLTGCFPFDSAEKDDEALFRLVCGDAETHLAQHPALATIEDPQAVDLIRNLLRQNPKTRYSVAEALGHPFLV